MRIMTFNLRFENDQDGANSWVYRRDLVVDLIGRYAPDVLGTQEGRWSQLTFLGERCPEYVLHAPERVLDDTCQYPTLFVRRAGYEILRGDEFWLSKTPEVHRSKDWDSAFPRMMSNALLCSRADGRRFWVAVTHLDHIGAEARRQQASILADWAAHRQDPLVLMGDFNDHPGSEVHRILTAERTGLRDSWQVLGRAEGPSSHTHHGFDGIPKKTRMDWILVSRHFHVVDARIVRDHQQGRYPSDHFPYMADLRWNSPQGS